MTPLSSPHSSQHPKEGRSSISSKDDSNQGILNGDGVIMTHLPEDDLPRETEGETMEDDLIDNCLPSSRVTFTKIMSKDTPRRKRRGSTPVTELDFALQSARQALGGIRGAHAGQEQRLEGAHKSQGSADYRYDGEGMANPGLAVRHSRRWYDESETGPTFLGAPSHPFPQCMVEKKAA